MQFLSAREVVKAQLVFNHIQSGKPALVEDARAQAAAEFRAALDLDPENDFTRERLAEATRDWRLRRPGAWQLRSSIPAKSICSRKQTAPRFIIVGDVRGLFTELAAAYGMKAQFDDSVQTEGPILCR